MRAAPHATYRNTLRSGRTKSMRQDPVTPEDSAERLSMRRKALSGRGPKGCRWPGTIPRIHSFENPGPTRRRDAPGGANGSNPVAATRLGSRVDSDFHPVETARA